MKRRVLLHGSFSTIGGPTTHLPEVVRLLKDAGFEVTVGSAAGDFSTRARPTLKADRVFAVPNRRRPATWLRWQQGALLWKYLGARGLRGYDVACMMGAGGYLCLMAPLVFPRGVLMYNYLSSGRPTRAPTFHTLSLRVADLVVCQAPSVARNLRHHYEVRGPIVILPHLTCARLALPEVPQRTGKSAGEHLRIGFFGRLDPDKGVELLLDVWPELAIGPASLAFYGDGEMKGALEAIAGEKRLASSVSFCGAYDAERDLPRLMRNTDLVVLPSREEGLALVLLEAMAHGVPFVTTNRGGTVDLADNNPDVEVCDPEPLALRRSIERIATRIRGGDISPARLQSRYKERYSYAVVAPKWVDLFLNAKEIAHSGQLVVEL